MFGRGGNALLQSEINLDNFSNDQSELRLRLCDVAIESLDVQINSVELIMEGAIQ